MIQASERRTSQNFHSWEATFYLLKTLDPPCSGPYKGQVVINSFSNKTKSFSHTNQIISMRLCTSATNKTSTTPRSRNCTQNTKSPHLMIKRNIKHDKNNTHFTFRCAHSISSVFLTTFGICFTFLLYIFTGALILFSFETSLESREPNQVRSLSVSQPLVMYWGGPQLLIMQHSLETKFIQSVQLFNAVAFCLKDEWDVILLCNMWSTLTFNLDLINGIGAYGQCRRPG